MGESLPAVGLDTVGIPIAKIQMQIAELKQSLETKNPGMSTMLRTIHAELRKDQTLVTLLTEDEISVVVSGLMKQTNVAIVVKATKSKGRSKGSGDLLADMGG